MRNTGNRRLNKLVVRANVITSRMTANVATDDEKRELDTIITELTKRGIDVPSFVNAPE